MLKISAIPPLSSELNLKVNSAGVVILKDATFRSRATGSKRYVIDPNGNLWGNTEYKKFIAADKLKRDPAKKKKPGGTPVNLLNFHNQNVENCGSSPFEVVQTYGDISTNTTELLTKNPDLSTQAKKPRNYRIRKTEIRQRILTYINTQKGKKELYFWTVTFPQGTTDDKAFQIYNIWLTSLRQYKMLRGYLWVAERQENGTIHFHIAIPHKMPVGRANAMMRGTLSTFAKRGEIPFSVHQCKRYNGVDIAKNRKTRRVTNFAIKKGARSLTTYLTKYVTKNDGVFTHLAWHNSRDFSQLFTAVTMTIPEFIGCGFNARVDRRRVINTEFFTYIPWNDSGPPEILLSFLYRINSYLQFIDDPGERSKFLSNSIINN